MRVFQTLVAFALLCQIESVHAVQIEPMGKALSQLLGTTKVFKSSQTVSGRTIDVFYAKSPDGKATRMAMIEKGIYEPSCTHTWAIGLDASGKVTGVRVIEMSCPHAFPCKSDSFLKQYVGKKPIDAPKLKSSINTIAKATGTSDLTTDAVIRVLQAFDQINLIR